MLLNLNILVYTIRINYIFTFIAIQAILKNTSLNFWFTQQTQYVLRLF